MTKYRAGFATAPVLTFSLSNSLVMGNFDFGLYNKNNELYGILLALVAKP